MNVTCYHCEPGCGCNDEQAMVNGALEVVTRSGRFENLSGRGVSTSWMSWDHEGEVNVSQIEDDTEGVGMGFLRAIAPGPDLHVWDSDSDSCSYLGFYFGCVVDVSEVDLHSVFDNSRGRNLAYDHRP